MGIMSIENRFLIGICQSIWRDELLIEFIDIKRSLEKET